MLMVNFIAELSSNRIKNTFESDFSNVFYFNKKEISLSTYFTILIKEQIKVLKNKSNS